MSPQSAGQAGAGRSGAGEGDLLGEAGALTACPSNLCGDGDIYALGRKCTAEGLLCDSNQPGGTGECARMQCCAGVWVYAEVGALACDGGGGQGGQGGQGGGR